MLVSELLRAGLFTARMRGSSDWSSVSTLLGHTASTVVIDCQEGGAATLNSLLTSSLVNATRQIIVCLDVQLCRAAPGRRDCLRWMEPPHPFSGTSLDHSCPMLCHVAQINFFRASVGSVNSLRRTPGQRSILRSLPST